MPEGREGDDAPNSYFGLTLLESIHARFPQIPIVILSSKPRKDVSLRFSRLGAASFIARDDLDGASLLQEAIYHHGLTMTEFGERVGMRQQ